MLSATEAPNEEPAMPEAIDGAPPNSAEGAVASGEEATPEMPIEFLTSGHVLL